MITDKTPAEIADLKFEEVLYLTDSGTTLAFTITETAHMMHLPNVAVQHAMAMCIGSFMGSSHACNLQDTDTFDAQFEVIIAVARRTYTESYKSVTTMIESGALKVEGVSSGKPS